MKIFIAVICFMFATVCSFAAQYESVNTGIVPFCDIDNNNKQSDILTAELTDSLSKYKFVKLIERGSLQELLKEIKFGMSDAVDESTVARAGKIQGLQIMITGTMEKGKITARAVQVETGKVIASALQPRKGPKRPRLPGR